MTRWRRTTPCERAAQWLSLELDGELGRIEQAGLVRHLRRCDRCREAGAEIRGFTELLRIAPAVEPPRPVDVAAAFRARLDVRRTLRTGALVLAAGAAVAAAATAVLLPHGQSEPNAAFVFVTPQEHHLFVRAHMLNEPPAYDPAPLTAAESFARRPLL